MKTLAWAARATEINDALQMDLDAPMGTAGVTHDDSYQIGTLVWVETGRKCNGHKEIVVKCHKGWVAFTYQTYSGVEEGVLQHCDSVGLPPASAPYTNVHRNSARQFRRIMIRYNLGEYLFKNKKGAMFFRLSEKIVAKLPEAKRVVNRLAEGMGYVLASTLREVRK